MISLPRLWTVVAATGAALTIPAAVEACATCVSSPFGDRTYSWPYLILILLPIVVAAVIGGVMMRVTGTKVSDLRPWLSRIIHPDARQEETT